MTCDHEKGWSAQTGRATDNAVASRATISVMTDRVRNAVYSLQSGLNSGTGEAISLADEVCDDAVGEASRIAGSVFRIGKPVGPVSDEASIVGSLQRGLGIRQGNIRGTNLRRMEIRV